MKQPESYELDFTFIDVNIEDLALEPGEFCVLMNLMAAGRWILPAPKDGAA